MLVISFKEPQRRLTSSCEGLVANLSNSGFFLLENDLIHHHLNQGSRSKGPGEGRSVCMLSQFLFRQVSHTQTCCHSESVSRSFWWWWCCSLSLLVPKNIDTIHMPNCSRMQLMIYHIIKNSSFMQCHLLSGYLIIINSRNLRVCDKRKIFKPDRYL